MKAMILNRIVNIRADNLPLSMGDIPSPEPKADEVLIKVNACAVCHTELDEIEGRTPPPKLPVVPGHQVVGMVQEVGSGVSHIKAGQRLGVAWIYSSCGKCNYCLTDRENLCPEFQATGRDVNGGYAEYMTVPAEFAFQIPDQLSDFEAAPLLCAGAIGYRSLRLTGISDGQRLGLYGFGASGHLVLKMARHRYPSSDIYVFARNPKEREFARELGACWAGDITDESPKKLDAIIETTPVWKPVVEALVNLAPGGRLVINAIRKEEGDKEYLLRLHYPTHLWMEKEIKSVANVTRRDVNEFLQLAAEMEIRAEIVLFSLPDANQALVEMKDGQIRGAKVLSINK
jgi:propanol-preferring alcohol dehydrogenase